MLTLVLATPRSGSNTFVDELDVPIWMPEDHPSLGTHREYYNFRKLPQPEQDRLQLKFHSKLRDQLHQQPAFDFCVKVLIGQVNNYILRDLIAQADTIHHTVRTNYRDQLRSFVAASFQDIWLNNRHTYQKISATQEDIIQHHQTLSTGIKLHSSLYHRYGGTVHTLEQRSQRPYKFKPIFDKNLSWPELDTAKLFAIDHK